MSNEQETEKGDMIEKLKKKIDAEKQQKITIEPPEKPKEMETKETGLKSQIAELNEKIDIALGKKDKKIKEKGFRFPFGMKGKLKKIAKQGKVQVILLQNNKNIKPTIGDIKEGMLFIGNKIYDGSTDHIWLWNGKTPTAIVMEWDLKPLTSDRLYTKTLEDKSISHPQTIMIRAMELAEVMQAAKPALGGKMLLWIVIGAIIVGYILFAK